MFVVFVTLKCEEIRFYLSCVGGLGIARFSGCLHRRHFDEPVAERTNFATFCKLL